MGITRIKLVRLRHTESWDDFPVDRLLSYDAILTWCDSGYSTYAKPLGDSLATVMDRGGAVVIATFATNSNDNGLQGRFIEEGYSALQLGKQIDGTNLRLGKTHLDPTHPLLFKVEQFEGGGDSFRSDVKLQDGAVLAAEWDDGIPLIAYKQCGAGCNVMLNYFPPDSTADNRCWDSDTDGWQMLVNALLFAMSSRTR